MQTYEQQIARIKADIRRIDARSERAASSGDYLQDMHRLQVLQGQIQAVESMVSATEGERQQSDHEEMVRNWIAECEANGWDPDTGAPLGPDSKASPWV